MTCETFVPYGEIVADLLRTPSLRFYMIVFLKQIWIFNTKQHQQQTYQLLCVKSHFKCTNDTLLLFYVAVILFTVGDQ